MFVGSYITGSTPEEVKKYVLKKPLKNSEKTKTREELVTATSRSRLGSTGVVESLQYQEINIVSAQIVLQQCKLELILRFLDDVCSLVSRLHKCNEFSS